MRKFARIDQNQRQIVAALRKAGCSVQSLASCGSGVPDLLVGHLMRMRPTNILMEVKDSDQPPSRRKLTPDEKRWHGYWRGQVCVVESVDDALKAVGIT